MTKILALSFYIYSQADKHICECMSPMYASECRMMIRLTIATEILMKNNSINSRYL